jgi:hypothetical protein
MGIPPDDEDPVVKFMRETRGELAGLPELDVKGDAGQSVMMGEWHDAEHDVDNQVSTALVDALLQSAAEIQAGIEPLDPFILETAARLAAYRARRKP